MPQKSPYSITLTAEQRHELEATARSYTRPYNDVIRAKIILYAADGMENKDIAQRLETTPAIVSKWRKRFFEEGMDGLKDLQRSGRPPEFPPLGRGQCQIARV